MSQRVEGREKPLCPLSAPCLTERGLQSNLWFPRKAEPAGRAGWAETPRAQAAWPPRHALSLRWGTVCLRAGQGFDLRCLQDTYAAFFKMDTDMDGIISMHDLHKLLLQLLLNLKKGEFERFLSLLGLRLSVTLNFREFQHLCEKRSPRTDEAPQRLIR